MNNFPINQPVVISENSNPFLPMLPINTLPLIPPIPNNLTPHKLVLSQSSQLMI